MNRYSRMLKGWGVVSVTPGALKELSNGVGDAKENAL